MTSAPTDAESSAVGRLGRELAEIDERLEKYAVVAKALAERREVIQRKELVDAMDAIRQDKMGLPEHNADIEVIDFVKAGLPNPDTAKDPDEAARLAVLRAEGLEWLSEEGHEGVIATVFSVNMPKGSLPLARLIHDTVLELFDSNSTPESRSKFLYETEIDGRAGLLRLLDERNEPGIDPGSASIAEGVHWATLTSLLKDLIRNQKQNPEDMPLEALGATVGRMAVIKKRKAKK